MKIKYIESSKNQYLSNYRKLKKKKWREKLGLMPIEGVILFKEALKRNVEIEYVIVSKKMLESKEIANLLGSTNKTSFDCYVVDENIFVKTAFTESPQGIVACAKIKSWSLVDILQAKKDIVFSAGIQDPGNLGTLMRASEAFGFGGVIIGEESVDPTNEKVIRSSMGSVLDLPVFKWLLEDDKKLIEEILKWNYNFVAADPRGNINSFDLDPGEHPLCIIVGNEVKGISHKVYKACRNITKAKIPISVSVDSLNAAVAGSILMYEVTKSRIHRRH